MSEGGGDREGAGAREQGRPGLAARPGAAEEQARRPRSPPATPPLPAPPPHPLRRRGAAGSGEEGRRKAAPRSPLGLRDSGRGNFRPRRAAQRPAPAAERTARSRAGFAGLGQETGKERGGGAGLGIAARDRGD